MINNVLIIVISSLLIVCLVWAFLEIIKSYKRKDERYFVKIIFVTCGIIGIIWFLYLCGWVNKIPEVTNKQNMNIAITALGLLYTLLILSIMLIVLAFIMIIFYIYKKRKSLSLRTEFDSMSWIYFLIMTFVSACHIYSVSSNMTDAKDLGEAVVVWWLILPLFVSDWLVYFLLCRYITKIKLNQRIDLLIEKSIKSCLIGIAAWSALFFNLQVLVKIPDLLNYFKSFCILGSIFPIFYPSLDMYEYTMLEIKDTLN